MMNPRLLLFALLAGAFLSGCVHEQLKSTGGPSVYGTIGSATAPITTAVVSNATPLSYQWYLDVPDTNGAGGSIALSNVTAASNGTRLFYQWYKNGTNIEGATNR